MTSHHDVTSIATSSVSNGAATSYCRASSIDKTSEQFYINVLRRPGDLPPLPPTLQVLNSSSNHQRPASSAGTSRREPAASENCGFCSQYRRSWQWYETPRECSKRQSSTAEVIPTPRVRPTWLQQQITFDADKSSVAIVDASSAAKTNTVASPQHHRVVRRPSSPPPLPPWMPPPSLTCPSSSVAAAGEAGRVLTRRHSGDIVRPVQDMSSRRLTTASNTLPVSTVTTHTAEGSVLPRYGPGERPAVGLCGVTARHAAVRRHSSLLATGTESNSLQTTASISNSGRRLSMVMTRSGGGRRGLVTSHSDGGLRVGEDVEIKLSCDSLQASFRPTSVQPPQLSTFHCQRHLTSSSAAAAATSEHPDSSSHYRCPDIVISCSPDSDDDADDVTNTGLQQVSAAFDQLLRQHGDVSTLDDVIDDILRLSDVTASPRRQVSNGAATLAAECRQLVLDCKQLTGSVFNAMTSDVTQAASRALGSLSAIVRHVTATDVTSAPAQLVSNVNHVVRAYQATVVAARQAVGSSEANSSVELANFIKHASTLARCLQLLLSNVN